MFDPNKIAVVEESGKVIGIRTICDKFPDYLFFALINLVEMDLSGGTAEDPDFKLPDPSGTPTLKVLNLYGNQIGKNQLNGGGQFNYQNFKRFSLVGQTVFRVLDIGGNPHQDFQMDFNGLSAVNFEEFRCSDCPNLQGYGLILEPGQMNGLRKIEGKNNPSLTSVVPALNGAGLTNGTFEKIDFSDCALSASGVHALLKECESVMTNDGINGVQVKINGGTNAKIPLKLVYSGGSYSAGHSVQGKDGGGNVVASGVILEDLGFATLIISRDTGDWSLATIIEDTTVFSQGGINSQGNPDYISALQGASWNIQSN